MKTKEMKTNKLNFRDFVSEFDNAGHIYFKSKLKNDHSKQLKFLVDTGFSLGFLFPYRHIEYFKFRDGVMTKMLLGDGSLANAISFIASLNIGERFVGSLSVVFLKGTVEAVIGVEFLSLLKKVCIDWEQKLVSIDFGRV